MRSCRNRFSRVRVELSAQHAGSDCIWGLSGRLVGQLAQKFLLVHVIFEGLAAIDENDRDFVAELAAELGIASTSISRQVNPPRRESLERLSLTTSQR